MSWAIGQNEQGRDIGYAVPAYCDFPGCKAEIDRGVAYTCGMAPDGGQHGCGLHFCGAHLTGPNQTCGRCASGNAPHAPKQDHPDWANWKLTHDSWAKWREANPAAVAALQAALEKKGGA
jgi:hypothetical protein